MKKDYYLRIVDKTTKKIRFTMWFEKVTFREAIYQAEQYLKGNIALTRNDYPNLDICLSSTSVGKYFWYKMKWKYDSPFNGNVSFEGWYSYMNGENNEANHGYIVKVAKISSIVFIVVFAVSLFILLGSLMFPQIIKPENLNLLKVTLGFLNFLLGLIYTGIISILRDEFNYSAETSKEIISHNLKLELPSTFAAASTIISFYTEEISKEVPIYVVIAVAFVGIGMKLMFDIISDIEKFYVRKEKNLYMK